MDSEIFCCKLFSSVCGFNRLSCNFWTFLCKSVILLLLFLYELKEDGYDDLHNVQMVKMTDALLLFHGRRVLSVNQLSSEARTQHRKQTFTGCSVNQTMKSGRGHNTEREKEVSYHLQVTGFFIALRERLEGRLGRLRAIVWERSFSCFKTRFRCLNSRSGLWCNAFKFCK